MYVDDDVVLCPEKARGCILTYEDLLAAYLGLQYERLLGIRITMK